MSQLIRVAAWPGKPRGHVVFVHGLGGHAYSTWTSDAGDDNFWPLWLARNLDGAAIWTLSYDAPATNWLGTAPPLQDRAVNVLELLLSEPELAKAPVTFICHSLGGLVIKQVLRTANDQQDHRPEAGSLIDRVKAVVFIATPHIGSAHATLLDWLRLIAWPSMAAQYIVRNDANLRNLNQWYRNWPNKIAHQIFYETQGTAAGTIVDPGSADAGLTGVVPIPIDADHIGICKPSSKDELLYKSVQGFLAKKVFARAKSRKSRAGFKAPELPALSVTRSNRWAPIALRLAMLLFVGFIGFKGIQATFFPGDPIAAATVQEIQQALRLKHPELTTVQIESFITSLREARGDPTFKRAVEEARKGNALVAEGIWKQIYEDRKKQRNKASKEQAKAARNLAAAAVVGNVAEGLRWYREATTLEPSNMEGWLGLGDAARTAGTVEEAERAFRRYISLAEKTGDDREESVGLIRLGEVLKAQGGLRGALESYRTSLAIAKRLTASDKNNAEWQRDLSVSHNKIGDVQVAQGGLTGALESFRTALSIRERLAVSDKNNARWQRDLSVSNSNIGNVQLAQGDLTGALESYRASHAIAKRLAASDKNNAGWQRDLSVSHNKIGDVQVDQGDLTAALESFRASLAIAKRLTALDKNNAGWQRGLSVSQDRIGEVQEAQGDLTGALESYRASLAITKRLTASDKNNAEWQRDLAISNSNIGNVLKAQGDLTGALESYRASLAIAKRLGASDKNNAFSQRGLSVSQERIGEVQEAQGDLTGALESYRASLTIRKRLAASDKNNAGWQRDLSVSQDGIGNVQEAQGDLTGALESYRASLAIRKRLAASNKNNAGWQHDLVWSHWRLAQLGDQPQLHWQKVVDILKKLDAEGRLAPTDQKWLPIAERNLAAAAQ